MKKTILALIAGIFFLCGLTSTVQAQNITLTFTGQDAADQYVQLDMVIVTNVTRGWQEILFWDDTVLVMENQIGIHEIGANGANNYSPLRLSQNNPNPFVGTTDAHLTVADAGTVTLEIVDGNGKIVGTHRVRPEIGTHQFRVTLATAGTYVMTARQNGQSSSIKMVCNGEGNGNRIEYLGSVETCHGASLQTKSTTNRPFQIGDQMEFVGYAIINGEEFESPILTQTLEGSQTIIIPFNETQLHYNLPVVITDTVSDITDFTATCGGTVTDDGGDSTVTRGVCWSTVPNPIIGNIHTLDGHGMGSFTSSLTGLQSGLTIYVRAYATNHEGTAYGNEVTFTIPINPNGDSRSCPSTPTLTDVDGNIYNTVQIGEQCWMRENLRTTRYADGTPIEHGNGGSDTTAFWYYPMGDAANKPNYGLLYNWPAVVRGETGSAANPSGVQGICPDGWHVPSDAEWTQLTDYVSTHSEYVCGGNYINIAKAMVSTVGWDLSSAADPCLAGNDTPATNNATGFGALPAGYGDNEYTNEFTFGGLGYYTTFWTSTIAEVSYDPVYYRTFHFNLAEILRNYDYGYGSAKSVRCIHD
ncbi:MAG: T9SS type A sorting domain-containing protein [Bacteroidales bacterium]|nr:T9SS type A sorting domain-containing protein [Bacteroidales bacterium]